MGRACTICEHRRRREIDKAICRGTSLRIIERQFGVSRAALFRHSHHLPDQGEVPLHFYAELARARMRMESLLAKSERL